MQKWAHKDSVHRSPADTFHMGVDVQAWVQRLHESNRSWVPIIDPGIKVDPGYAAYDEGIKADIFLKDASGKPYQGKVC